jgi:SAM-dependent methyltransferase
MADRALSRERSDFRERRGELDKRPSPPRAAAPLISQRGVADLVHSDDEMLLALLQANQADADQALFRYFQIGAEIADSLKEILAWHSETCAFVGDILDLASGFGRVTRFLVKDFATERLWVSDILPKAMAFQHEQFGVHAIVSTTNPSEFQPDHTFSAISVFSLFTHLPRTRFESWLVKLSDLLDANGLLIFSVHDEAILPDFSRLADSDGFLFVDFSESKTLSTAEYGCTWVNEEFVRSVAEIAARARKSIVFPGAFATIRISTSLRRAATSTSRLFSMPAHRRFSSNAVSSSTAPFIAVGGQSCGAADLSPRSLSVLRPLPRSRHRSHSNAQMWFSSWVSPDG